MRIATLLLLPCLSGAAYADDPKLAPPPPPLDQSENPDQPQVTIKKETEQTVEEYRSHGKLYMIKITPKHGKPYYLIDDRGDGKFARQESLDSGLRVPVWVIHKF
ncbi:MAG: DUF2782 domain-containing protein [Gallionellaceae bacterium]|nr:MAG: DUF2782 domain-containing protein [Gallionellaceae bacterium]